MDVGFQIDGGSPEVENEGVFFYLVLHKFVIKSFTNIIVVIIMNEDIRFV